MVQVLGWLLATLIRYALYLIEALALLILARRAFSAPRFCDPWFSAVEKVFRTLARRRRLAVLSAGMLVLLLRAALLPVLPVREPMITDEFSYLLAADTFASGRLSNPTHPMWIHFESMHILVHPTYASMYHLAQGMILALGKVVAGHAWLGVYASVALMCALFCWMLQGWLPPGWALLGGMLAVMRLGLFGYWINSYWGGAAAAIGGLLVLGALPRIMRKARVRDALLMASGMAVLANSRPYEGFVLSVPVCAILLAWALRKQGPGLRVAILKVALPALVVLAVTGSGMCYYYRRVTGNPFRVPYQLSRDTYAAARIFVWESPNPAPAYRHQTMRNFYVGWELAKFMEAKTFTGLAKNSLGKLVTFWMFFLGPALTVPLIFLPRIVTERRLRPLVIIGAVALAGLSVNVWFYPHYAAPISGLIYAMVLQGMRHLRVWGRRGRPSGLLLARSIPAVCAGMVLVRLCALPLGAYYMPTDWPMAWYYTPPGNTHRARILAQLKREPGRHLAIVRYKPEHNYFEEWVYNEAGIDAASVVWAREMDAPNNRALIRYFHDRRPWLVEPDAKPPAFSPYLSRP